MQILYVAVIQTLGWNRMIKTEVNIYTVLLPTVQEYSLVTALRQHILLSEIYSITIAYCNISTYISL